eukprot:gene8090-biopygen167
MNSSHEEGVRERNRAGIEAADPTRDRQLRFQLDSARKHRPRDMSSETGPCYAPLLKEVKCNQTFTAFAAGIRE